jgi:hypothetical protein
MHGVVVRVGCVVALLDEREELPDDEWVEPVVLEESIFLKIVEDIPIIYVAGPKFS